MTFTETDKVTLRKQNAEAQQPYYIVEKHQ